MNALGEPIGPDLDRSRAARQQRKQALPQTLSQLRDAGVTWECLDHSAAQYRLTTRSGWVVDFWGGTQSWRVPGRTIGILGRGFDELMSEISRRDRAA